MLHIVVETYILIVQALRVFRPGRIHLDRGHVSWTPLDLDACQNYIVRRQSAAYHVIVIVEHSVANDTAYVGVATLGSEVRGDGE